MVAADGSVAVKAGDAEALIAHGFTSIGEALKDDSLQTESPDRSARDAGSAA